MVMTHSTHLARERPQREALITQAIQGLPSETVMEIAVGLIAIAAMRAQKEGGRIKVFIRRKNVH